MKIKNKGKVHPSPSSSSSSSSSSSFSSSSAIPYPSNGDFLSVLNLLPAAILALTSVLSIQDREVLAYMITRSMNTTSPSSFIQTSRKKSSNKNNHSTHNTPCFDCGCFDCYTSYWFRWDSSPNREFIHLAIEAFEDHLTNVEIPKKNSSKGKKKERMARRTANNLVHVSPQKDISAPEVLATSTEKAADEIEVNVESEATKSPLDLEAEELELAVILRTTATNSHKGLARKVLPDVLGLLNSRLWSLWSPNV